jgi:putative protease
VNRNLDHNWQQALPKPPASAVSRSILNSAAGRQLVLTMTSEEGVSVTHTLDGEFAEATNAEKALANLRDGVAKLGQTMYYARNIQMNLPGALFVPNSLLNPAAP